MYLIDFKRKEGGLTYYPPLSAILEKHFIIAGCFLQSPLAFQISLFS